MTFRSIYNKSSRTLIICLLNCFYTNGQLIDCSNDGFIPCDIMTDEVLYWVKNNQVKKLATVGDQPYPYEKYESDYLTDDSISFRKLSGQKYREEVISFSKNGFLSDHCFYSIYYEPSKNPLKYLQKNRGEFSTLKDSLGEWIEKTKVNDSIYSIRRVYNNFGDINLEIRQNSRENYPSYIKALLTKTEYDSNKRLIEEIKFNFVESYNLNFYFFDTLDYKSFNYNKNNLTQSQWKRSYLPSCKPVYPELCKVRNPTQDQIYIISDTIDEVKNGIEVKSLRDNFFRFLNFDSVCQHQFKNIFQTESISKYIVHSSPAVTYSDRIVIDTIKLLSTNARVYGLIVDIECGAGSYEYFICQSEKNLTGTLMKKYIVSSHEIKLIECVQLDENGKSLYRFFRKYKSDIGYGLVISKWNKEVYHYSGSLKSGIEHQIQKKNLRKKTNKEPFHFKFKTIEIEDYSSPKNIIYIGEGKNKVKIGEQIFTVEYWK